MGEETKAEEDKVWQYVCVRMLTSHSLSVVDDI